MPKVVLLIPCLLTGGTEVATLETATALQALGCTTDVVVYFNEVDKAMHHAFTAAGITVRCLGLERKAGTLAKLKLAVGLARALATRPQWVWVQYMTPTLLPLLIARLFCRRLVAAVHVAAGHYSPGGQRRMRWLARWWCDCIVCVSHTTAQGLFGPASQQGYFGGSVKVIPNAIDLALVPPAKARNWRSELGLPSHAVLLGFVGRLVHIKGVDVLLHAAKQMSPAYPRLHWVVVGEGSEKQVLEQLVLRLGLNAVVHFVGGVPPESVYSVIKGLDMIVLPSREEGFGLVAIEVMACGVPLVASRVDALQEVVFDGETGLLCLPDSPTDLAQKISMLLNNSLLREQLARRGVAHIKAYYDKPVVATQLEALLKELN